MKLQSAITFAVVLIFCANSAWALPSFKEVKARLRDNPNNLKLHFLLGKMYLMQGKYKRTLREWYFIVKQRPRVWSVHNRIGLVWYKIGVAAKRRHKYDETKRYWKKALSFFKRVLRNDERNVYAKRAYLKILARYRALPPLEPIDEGRDVSLQEKKNSENGQNKQDDNNAAKEPEVPSLEEAEDLFNSAYALYCNEKFREASEKFKRVALTDYKKPETLLYLGECYLKEAEEPDTAIAFFKKRLELGSNARTFFNLGAAYGLKGDFTNQISNFEESLKLDPDDPETHFQLALAYDKVDKPNKTVEHAQRAVQLDPSFKKRLQPLIKNSKVARRIGNIITDVLRETETSQLSDEQIDEYARRVGEILGEENIDPGRHNGQDMRQRLKGIFRDKKKRKAFTKFFKAGQPEGQIDKLAKETGFDVREIKAGMKALQSRGRRRH